MTEVNVTKKNKMFKRKSDDTATKTFEYRLRPSKKFTLECERVLESCRRLYNDGLAQRKRVYASTGENVSFAEQSRYLTIGRASYPEKYDTVLRAIQVDALRRLDKAFAAFFQRCKDKKSGKSKKKVGYPRFKSRDYYDSFSQNLEPGRACPIRQGKLFVPGVGSTRIILSRPVEGKVKQLRIIRKADGWYTQLVCEIAKPLPLPKTGRSTGVDVNIKNLCTLSDGQEIENPKFLKQNTEKLALLQRRASRKKKGSQNRRKANKLVAKLHKHIADSRKHNLHQVSTYLVREFDKIVFEDIQILNLVKNGKLAKHILDAGWGLLRTMTTSKAESASREVGSRNPAYTSQTCCKCGFRQPMPLNVRVFDCERCKSVMPRDQNAAVNIELGVPKSLSGIYACGVGATTKAKRLAFASSDSETGTVAVAEETSVTTTRVSATRCRG